MSRRESILAAVLVALNTGTPGGVPQTVRLQRRQVEADAGMTFYPVREEVVPKSNRWGGSVERGLAFVVECRVKSDTPDQALDPLVTWVTAALIEETRLGGLILDMVEQRTEWDFTQREEGFGLAAIQMQANYLTKRNDQTVAG